MRFRGIELMVKIDYRNRCLTHIHGSTHECGSFFVLEKPSYKYTVRRIPFAEYKITEPRYEKNSRTLINRFGVKIHFVQSGQIARFSWNALIMEIVAGLTLLGVAQLIVDNVAFYLHPKKD